MRVGKDGIFEKLRKEELGRIESGSDIYKRLERDGNGEAVLDQALIQTFESIMMEGNSRINAARVVGLSRKRMETWLKQGAADVNAGRPTIEAEFTWTVDRCEGEQERQLVLSAMRAAMSPSSDGTLALKILERRNPDEWAPALPEGETALAQYVGLQKSALKAEAQRVLALVAKEASTEEVEVNVERPELHSER